MKRTSLLTLFAIATTACGTPDAPLGQTESAIWRGPPGHDAALVSHNLPATVRAGERLNVRFEIENTGSASPTDDWAAGEYYVRGMGTPRFPWGLRNKAVTGAIAVGETATVDLVLTAPAAGTSSFEAAMLRSGPSGGTFGAFEIPVAVDDTTAPRWACSFLAADPAGPLQLAPGEVRSIDVTVRNDGQAPWARGRECLRTMVGGDDLGGRACPPLASDDVAAGDTVTETITVMAPMTAGAYQLERQMFGTGRPSTEPAPFGSGVGYFSAQPCVSIPVNVSGAPQYLDAAVVSHTIPSMATAGDRIPAQVTLQNTGTLAWLVADDIVLRAAIKPIAAIGLVQVDQDVAPGASVTLDLVLRVRDVNQAGPASYAFQLFKKSSPAYPFGDRVEGTMTIAELPLDAALISESFPRTMAPGESATVQVQLQNSGNIDWPADALRSRLYSKNSPLRLWSLVQVLTDDAVAPGEAVTFELEITAPSTPGDYRHRWSMYAHTFFGPELDIPVTVTAAPATYTFDVTTDGLVMIEVSSGAQLTFHQCYMDSCSFEIPDGASVYIMGEVANANTWQDEWGNPLYEPIFSAEPNCQFLPGSLVPGGSGTLPEVLCSGTMDQDYDFELTWAREEFSLFVTVNGPGQITSDLAGIICGTDCEGRYFDGQIVTLTADVPVGAQFDGWAGACSGTALTCAVTMDALESVTANFSSTGTGGMCAGYSATIPVIGENCVSGLGWSSCSPSSSSVDVMIMRSGATWTLEVEGQSQSVSSVSTIAGGLTRIRSSDVGSWLATCQWTGGYQGAVTVDVDETTGALAYAEGCGDYGAETYESSLSGDVGASTCL